MCPEHTDQLPADARTVLHLLHAHQLFIGDEMRVSALRAAWDESGQMPDAFGQALRELQARGLVRSVHGTAGPAVVLTEKGYRTSSAKPRHHPAQPLPAQPIPPATPARAGAQPQRPPRKSARPKTPAPSTTDTAPAKSSIAATGESIAHSRVFRTRNAQLNDQVLKHCLLGLLQHYKVPAEGEMSYEEVMFHWDEMGLTRADLLYTLELLIGEGCIRTTTRPHETIILTAQGHARAHSHSDNLDDGMDRWQAKKRLRLTIHLGSITPPPK